MTSDGGRKLERLLSLDDFELAAERHLPKPVFAYVSGGSENAVSLRENRAIFDELRLVPRVLVDVSALSLATSLFGETHSAPFGIAPMGIAALSAYRGDLVLAEGASRLGIPSIMSGSSLIRLEEVAARAPATWFQLYVPSAPERCAALLERVAAAGYRTLVVTVDTAVVASRENNIRAGFSTPLRPSPGLLWQGVTHPRWSVGTFLKTLLRHGVPHFENNDVSRGVAILSGNVARDVGGRDRFSWDSMKEVRGRWKGRLIIKGILHRDDVARGRELGADAVILSNHGGRQLDGVPSPLRMLPAAVEAARSMPILIDSGFRRGTDVLKALALGARFVFIGRPFNYAASVAGPAGVAHAYKLLAKELLASMALLGVNSVGDLRPDHVMRIAHPQQ